MTFDRIQAELRASLLEASDMDVRELTNPERAATGLAFGIEGYVIPYRNLEGKPVPFYRVKCFDILPKYKQTKGTGNAVYIPKGFQALAIQKGYVILTEGEKKAASATKQGFPSVGFGGVDSWRDRTIVLPEQTELRKKASSGSGDQVIAKLPPGQETADVESTLATGFGDIIDLCVEHRLKTIICYDTDNGKVSYDVQRAAAALGFELRFRGLPLLNIKQLLLPTIEGLDKVGLDDYLVVHGGNELLRLLIATLADRNNFPRHPNPREFVNRKLQKTKMPRKEAQQVSLSILCELDGMGSRLRDATTDALFYFHGTTKQLLPASLKKAHNDALADSPFSRFLYQQFGIGSSDMRLLSWLANQFTSEEPIDFVSPNKVCTTRGDEIYFQINDGQYIAVTPNESRPWEIRDNGTAGVLFEAGSVEALSRADLERALTEVNRIKFKPWWLEVLGDVRLKRDLDAPERLARNSELISMIFYLSPFINKWRGTQLPIEMIIGEAGSGKSSLYELRLNILLGTPTLRNSPQDLRDWHASIASSGGLHVTDNVHLTDKNLKQRLSDEMCRIVTEPKPHIEMRRLYTETDLLRIPVNSVFAITAIQQPFRNTDLIQRSFIIELDKGDTETSTSYESSWANDQLQKFGGRANWVAHHILVLHRFLRLVAQKWDPRYVAKHRLTNFEQCLVLMAQALNYDSAWIPEYLAKMTKQIMADNDWVLQGLSDFAKKIKVNGRDTEFSSKDISEWAMEGDEYDQCHQLTNSRSLGRYLQINKSLVATITNIKEAGKKNNLIVYRVF